VVESFETYRPYLFSVAYRMLGSAMDAEDMVQETFVRFQKTPPETILSLKAFLTTIITRLCMDQLHLARKQREVYPGPWLPEPILTEAHVEMMDPEASVDMEESVSLAFLILLEQLQPVERAVFLLREVFDYEYAEIAAMLGKSEVACRQWFSRARKHLAEHRPRFPVGADAHRQLLTSFFQAVQGGNLDELTHILAEDVAFWADGGGKVKGAAAHPLAGRGVVAEFILGSGRIFRDSLPPDAVGSLVEVNGQPSIVIRSGPRALSVVMIEVSAGLIQTIRFIANPDKLSHLNPPVVE
jgi:RNA polymerase sigma-70 factor, ECF subfamily